MKPVIVDVHCHNFNADDLPLKGFVQHVLLNSSELGSLLATLIDNVLKESAPGYREDMIRIRSLLAPTPKLPVSHVDSDKYAPWHESDILAASDQSDLRVLNAQDPVFVRRLGCSLQQEFWLAEREKGKEQLNVESFPDIGQHVRRAFDWAKMFGQSRVDLTSALVSAFDHSVDLFCPLWLDLGLGLGESPNTTIPQQIELAEGLSLLSMKGQLPGGGKAKIHPFVGFDPRRQIRAVREDSGETPLDIVMDAVLNHGFIGVKVYPSMGWRPIGNGPSTDMTAAEAVILDAELRKFYKWCEDEQVPITAHANHSNSASPSYSEFAGPAGWQAVLEEFPNLHLNLGHFGGARVGVDPNDWPGKFARLISTHRHVFADVGNHKIYDRAIRDSYVEQLRMMFLNPSTAQADSRIMYGSDWYMLALYPDSKGFLRRYQGMYEEHFGPERTQKFIGQNALAFLGFNDWLNSNARRLWKYYRLHGIESFPPWLAVPPSRITGE